MRNDRLARDKNPDFLPGDLLRDNETGALMTAREVSDMQGQYHQVSVSHLPGQPHVKTAWWAADELTVVEKGPAHKHWAAGVDAHIAEQERRANVSNVEWIVEHWAEMDKGTLEIATAGALLQRAGLYPRMEGLASRGEIGIMSMVVADAWHNHRKLLTGLLDRGVFLETYPSETTNPNQTQNQ